MTVDGSVGTESEATATGGIRRGRIRGEGRPGAPEEIQAEGKSSVAKVKELLHERATSVASR